MHTARHSGIGKHSEEHLVITFQGGLLPLKDRILYFPMASFRFRGSNSSAYGSSSIPLALLPEGNAILYVAAVLAGVSCTVWYGSARSSDRKFSRFAPHNDVS